ncbi:hypothetical protein [Rubrivivax gelatinosus]|uniref:Uncharacterized protein n=1 Tax=Rubrivivax gelatinosus TaxID=28068 RepID=A0A4R2MKM3_RUBGE|nr:hypothetical protein [Rubrivivax gelatinosus]TCP05597.1 hypothetical protein EV684_101469 [Rubrivivax gelatinosus]
MKLRTIAALFALSAPGIASAQTQEFTAYDWATLPKYCDARLRGDEASKNLWSDRIGQEHFIHVHHFCFGLHYLNKAKFTFDKRKKNEAIEQAIKQFDYVIQRWQPSSTFRADAIRYQQQARSMRMP